jgi:hypothetical protein
LGADVGDGVAGAGRDGDGVAGANLALLALDLHSAAALEKVVDFLRSPMEVRRCETAGRQSRLGEALVGTARVAVGEQLADF